MILADRRAQMLKVQVEAGMDREPRTLLKTFSLDGRCHRALDAGPGLVRPARAQHVAIGFWRNPGEDLEIDTSERHHGPTHTNALTCEFDTVSRSAIFQGLIRDEERRRFATAVSPVP